MGEVRYTMLITRDIIHEDLQFKNENMNRAILSYKINDFKTLLLSHNAKKGDIVALSIIEVNHLHVAALFACAELGLRVILIDAPATKQSLPYTKLALHGPADFCIDDGRHSLYDGLHGEMIKTYSKKLIDLSELNQYCYTANKQPWQVSPEDPFLISSTSGSTSPSRKVEFSHEEVYEISKRNIDIFKFDEESKVMHTRNMHHASALLTPLLPSLMASKYHDCFLIPDKRKFITYSSKKLRHKIKSENFTHMMVSNIDTLKWFIDNTIAPFPTKLIMNMSGFTMTQEFIDMSKQYNIEFMSHYGSIDTAIPLLVNHITPESKHNDKCLGVLPDDYYQLTLNPDHSVEVMCRLWNKPRKMDDLLYMSNNKFYLQGRVDNVMNETIQEAKELDIDLDLFFQDTKINMEQLRGHLKNIKKSA